MAHDSGIRIIFVETFQQLEEGMLLFLGTGVSCNAFLIIASFIADAKRTVVVMTGMCPTDRLRQNGNHVAIASDIVVVRRLSETCIACSNEACNSEGLVAARTGTVDYQ